MSHVPNEMKLARLEEKVGNPIIEGKPQPEGKVGVAAKRETVQAYNHSICLDPVFWERWGGLGGQRALGYFSIGQSFVIA